MRLVVREVSFALARYANREKWSEADYWIYYSIEADWDVVKFVFVSRHFDGKDERACYLDVWRFLVESFKDDPEIFKYFSLVVRSKVKVDEGGLYGISPGYREFWTFYPVQKS